jgi:hypothetical protein
MMTPIPEPSSLFTLGFGLCGVGWVLFLTGRKSTAKILVALSILVICDSSTAISAQTEEDFTAIGGKVMKVDTQTGAIVVKHKCQIIDPQTTFVKEDDITYKIEGDTALVKVETVTGEDGTSAVKETPILLADLKSGDQVRVGYITRDWEIIVRKLAITK